jgi:hypothetical protein
VPRLQAVTTSSGWRTPRRAAGTGDNHYVKDFHVLDGLGAFNNAKLGPAIVYRRPPTADVSGGWTSTAATKFDAVDEADVNDADYISAVWPAPAAQLFDVQDLPADVVSVRGVMMLARMSKSDGGDGQVQMGIKSGASTGLGTDRAISTAKTYYWDVKEADPNTGVAFTPAGFNAAQLQINRTL